MLHHVIVEEKIGVWYLSYCAYLGIYVLNRMRLNVVFFIYNMK